ncbi:hypothetical protein AB0M20_36865 [Actinoplanes sp. NPDC051633]|uniref:hypothetical protein n=1 Tax=Actinoplanes sp. NPDC051633 TaxID=3155670 RepID=UPI003422030D
MSERTGGPTDTNPTHAGDPATEPEDIESARPIVLSDEPDEGSDESRKIRARKIVLIGLLVVVAIGLAGLAVAGLRINSQKDATLNPPTSIGRLALDQTEAGKTTADYLTTALAAEVDLDKTVGAVYSDTGAPDKTVLFFGGTALIWSPENDLDSAFDLVADDQGAVTGIHEVDAGSLGGTMKCGATATAEGDLTVCGWADHGTLALALFPSRPEAESATLMREIRDATQSRD